MSEQRGFGLPPSIGSRLHPVFAALPMMLVTACGEPEYGDVVRTRPRMVPQPTNDRRLVDVSIYQPMGGQEYVTTGRRVRLRIPRAYISRPSYAGGGALMSIIAVFYPSTGEPVGADPRGQRAPGASTAVLQDRSPPKPRIPKGEIEAGAAFMGFRYEHAWGYRSEGQLYCGLEVFSPIRGGRNGPPLFPVEGEHPFDRPRLYARPLGDGSYTDLSACGYRQNEGVPPCKTVAEFGGTNMTVIFPGDRLCENRSLVEASTRLFRRYAVETMR